MVDRTHKASGRKDRMITSLNAAQARSRFRKQNWHKGDLDKVIAHLGLVHKSSYLPGERLDHDVADLHAPVPVVVAG